LPKNVHLIPSRRNLDNLEIDLRTRNRYADPRDSLKKPLEKLQGKYDFIFLDTAPHVTPATLAAYKAARWFVIAVTPEPLGVQGMIEALEDIKQAKEFAGSQIELLGVLMSRVDKRTRLSTQLVQFVRENFPSNSGAFSTNIGTAVAIANAQEQGKTVLQTEPTHRSAEEYRAVARELAERLQARTSAAADTLEELAKGVVNG
jgi:chromosome partitioning protein